MMTYPWSQGGDILKSHSKGSRSGKWGILQPRKALAVDLPWLCFLRKHHREEKKKTNHKPVEANSFLLLLVGKGLCFSQSPGFEKPGRDNAERSGLDAQLGPAAPGLGTMSLPRPWDAAPSSCRTPCPF